MTRAKPLGADYDIDPLGRHVGTRCHTPSVGIIAASMPGVIAAVVASYLSFRFATRAVSATERRIIKRETAADLGAPLRDLRTLARALGRVETSPEEVRSAVLAWFDAYDRRRHLLPPKWTDLGRSVRAAILTVFGGIGFSDLRPDTGDSELAEPDFLWQDFADDYLSYAIDGVARWGDGQRLSKPLRNFDDWLLDTGRRDADPK